MLYMWPLGLFDGVKPDAPFPTRLDISRYVNVQQL